MLTTLPWPLAVALVLSYVGLTVLGATVVNLRRWTLRTARRSLLGAGGLIATSIVLRTTYYALA